MHFPPEPYDPEKIKRQIMDLVADYPPPKIGHVAVSLQTCMREVVTLTAERDALRAAVAELVVGLEPFAAEARGRSWIDCLEVRGNNIGGSGLTNATLARAAELVAKYGGKEVGT